MSEGVSSDGARTASATSDAGSAEAVASTANVALSASFESFSEAQLPSMASSTASATFAANGENAAIISAATDSMWGTNATAVTPFRTVHSVHPPEIAQRMGVVALEDLESELQVLRTEVGQLRVENRNLKAENLQLKAAANENDKLKRWEDLEGDLEDEGKKDEDEEKSTLLTELLECRQRIDKYVEEVESLQSALGTEKFQLLEKQKEIFSLKSENVKLENEIRIQNQRLSALQQSEVQIQNTLKQEREFNAQVNGELSILRLAKSKTEMDSKNRILELEEEVGFLRDTQSKANQELLASRQSYMNIQNELEQSKNYSARKIQLKTEMLQVKDAIIKKHETKLTNCLTEIQEFHEEMESTALKVADLENEVKKYKEKLKASEEEKENLKSVYGNEQSQRIQSLSMMQLKDLIERKFKDNPEYSSDDKVLQLMVELEAKTTECLQYRGSYLTAQADLDILRVNQEQSSFEFKQLTEQNGRLGLENEKLNESLQNAFKSYNQISEQQNAVKTRLKNAEEKVLFLTNNNAQLIENLATVMYDKDNLPSHDTDETAFAFRHYAEMTEQNNQLKLNLQRLLHLKESEAENKMVQMELDLEAYRKQLDRANTEREAFAKESLSIIEDLQNQRVSLEKELKLLKAEGAGAVCSKDGVKEAESLVAMKLRNEEQTDEEAFRLVKEISHLAKTLRTAQEEYQRSIEQNLQLQQSLATANATSNFFEKRTNDLTVRLDDLQQTLQNYVCRLTEADERYRKALEEREKLSTDLLVEGKHSQELQRQIEELHTKLKLESMMVNDLQKSSETAMSENLHRVSTLTENLAETKVALKLYEKQYNQLLDKHEEDIKLFQNQIKTLTANNKVETTKRRRLEESVREKADLVETTKAELQNLKMDASVMKAQLEERTKHVEFLKNQTSPKQQSQDVLSEDASEGATHSSTLQQQLQNTSKQLEQAQTELQSALSMQKHWRELAMKNKKEIEARKDEIAALQEEANAKISEVALLEDHRTKLQEELKSKNSEITVLSNEIEHLTEKLKPLEDSEAQKRIELNEHYIKAIEEEKAMWAFDKEQFENAIRQEVQSHSRDIENFQRIKIENDNLKAKISELQDILSSQNKELQRERNEKTIEMQMLERKVSNQQDVLNRSKKDVENLESLLKQRVEVLSDESIGMQIEEIMLQKADLEHEIEGFHIQVAQLEMVQRRLEKELEDERDKVQKEQFKFRNVEIDLENYKISTQQIAENATLRNTVNHLRSEWETAQRALEEWKRRFDEETKSSAPLKLKVEQLKAELSVVECQKNKFQEQAKSWEESYTRIIELYTGVDRDAFMVQKEEIEALKAQVVSSAQEKRVLIASKEEVVSRCTLLSQQVSELTENVKKSKETQSELQSAALEKESLRVKCSELTQQLATASKEMQSLKTANAAVNKVRAELAREQEHTRDLTEQLKAQKVPVEAKLSSAMIARIYRLGRVAAWSAYVAKCAISSAGSCAEKFNEQQQIQDLANAAAAISQKQMEALNAQLQKREEELQKLKEDCSLHLKRVEALESEGERLRSENQQFQMSIQHMREPPPVLVSEEGALYVGFDAEGERAEEGQSYDAYVKQVSYRQKRPPASADSPIAPKARKPLQPEGFALAAGSTDFVYARDTVLDKLQEQNGDPEEAELEAAEEAEVDVEAEDEDVVIPSVADEDGEGQESTREDGRLYTDAEASSVGTIGGTTATGRASFEADARQTESMLDASSQSLYSMSAAASIYNDAAAVKAVLDSVQNKSHVAQGGAEVGGDFSLPTPSLPELISNTVDQVDEQLLEYDMENQGEEVEILDTEGAEVLPEGFQDANLGYVSLNDESEDVFINNAAQETEESFDADLDTPPLLPNDPAMAKGLQRGEEGDIDDEEEEEEEGEPELPRELAESIETFDKNAEAVTEAQRSHYGSLQEPHEALHESCGFEDTSGLHGEGAVEEIEATAEEAFPQSIQQSADSMKPEFVQSSDTQLKNEAETEKGL